MAPEPLGLAEPATIKPPKNWEWCFDAPVTGLAFARSGRCMAAALGDGTVMLISRTELESEPQVVEAHDGAVLCLQAEAVGDRFLSGGDDGRLAQISGDGTHRVLLHAPGQWIDTIAVADTVRAVALGREVRLVNAAGGEIGRTAEHPSSVSGLAFNPKGKRLAVSHYNGVTLWWAASLGGTPARYRWRGSHIGVSWSPDGKFLMTATQENELHGWRLADGEDMRMSGYMTKVRSLAWIAKPPFLVTAGSDSVTAWPFAGGGPMGKNAFEFGRRERYLVTCVATHPKRPLVAFGYDDGEVRVAEVPGSRMVTVRPATDDKVVSLAWSPDGAAIGVGDSEGIVSLIDLSRSGGPL
jgi:WD40 repeat protein